MENRKKLHDLGLALVIIGILNLFMFISTVIESIVDGTVAEALTTVEADILVAVKIILVVICVFFALVVSADVLIGIKALKVSKNPNADKGYITAAKVFFVMSVIAAISAAVALFDGSVSITDAILNLSNAILGASIYFLFIKAAQDVRKDVLNGAK